MVRCVLLAVALNVFAGCATNEPQYQIGIAGSRKTKIEAERAHAGESPQTGPSADIDFPPRILLSRFPDYPLDLRNAGIDGQVVVRFTVELDGSVSDPAVQGSPPPELAVLALDAISRWKFTPATKNGLPIRTRLQQPFVFKTE